MKTNKLLVASAAATMMMTGLTTNAYAEGATGTSNATVRFDLPKDAVPVKDPRNPNVDKPINLEEGITLNNSQSAGLSLDYVTNLNFGEGKFIEGKEQTFETTTTEPFIQVSDRRGTGAGWKLTVGASRFKDATGKDSLNGAKIEFDHGKVKDAVGSLEPVVQNVTIDTSAENTTQSLVKAEGKATDAPLAKAHGLGTWIMSWLPDENPQPSIKLIVPANEASEGTHTAKLTWTLTSGV